MEEYLVCVYFFSASSLESLRIEDSRDEVGALLYAVGVGGVTYAELQEIRLRNWIEANSWAWIGPRFEGFNMNPFVERIELDTENVEYHVSEIAFFSLEAAAKLWSKTDTAAARAAFDRWLRSTDATMDKPANRECEVLRRIMDEAVLVAGTAARKKYPDQPKKVGDKSYRKEADRQLVLNAVAHRIIEAAFGA